MTLRTFPLSRQRRRHVGQRSAPLVPVEDGQRHSAPPGDDAVAERKGAPPSRDNGEGATTPASGVIPVRSRLPHEHDEHIDKPQPPRPRIAQAQEDLASGQQDTDLRNSAATIVERNEERNRGGS